MCALAFSCFSLSAAVRVNYRIEWLGLCGGLCWFGFFCVHVCDFVRLSLLGHERCWFSFDLKYCPCQRKSSDLQVRSSEALLIVYVFSVGLFAVTQVLYDDDRRWTQWKALAAIALTMSLMIMSATCRPLRSYWPTPVTWSTPWRRKSTPSCNSTSRTIRP